MQVKLPDFICSHVPMEIFLFYEMGKKCGNKKRFVYGRGGSFGCPPWRRMHSYTNLPYYNFLLPTY
jgi:hypothetical protein